MQFFILLLIFPKRVFQDNTYFKKWLLSLKIICVLGVRGIDVHGAWAIHSYVLSSVDSKFFFKRLCLILFSVSSLQTGGNIQSEEINGKKNMQIIEWNIYLHVSWKALKLDWLNTRLRAERVKDILFFRSFWQNLELLSLWFETLRFQILKWWNLFLWNSSICNNSLHQFYETNKITSCIYFKD